MIWTIPLAAIMIGADIGAGFAQDSAANADKEAIDLQAKQAELSYETKTISNYDVLQKVIQKQIAQQSMSGTSFSSPSFNAIQRNTVNVGSRAQQNLNTQNSLMQENFKREKNNVDRKLYADLFGDVAKAASGIATIALL